MRITALLLATLVGLVQGRATPPLSIFGNEYIFSTFHYQTRPDAGQHEREEYARQYGPFGSDLVKSLSHGHPDQPPPPPPPPHYQQHPPPQYNRVKRYPTLSHNQPHHQAQPHGYHTVDAPAAGQRKQQQQQSGGGTTRRQTRFQRLGVQLTPSIDGGSVSDRRQDGSGSRSNGLAPPPPPSSSSSSSSSSSPFFIPYVTPFFQSLFRGFVGS